MSRGKVIEVALRGGSALQLIPYRVTIEGQHWASSVPELKNMVRDAIVDAANEIPGAEVLYVSTRFRGKTGSSNAGVKRGTHSPKDRSPQAVRRGTQTPSKSARSVTDLDRSISATKGAAVRFGWSQERLTQAIEDLENGKPPLRGRGWPDIKATKKAREAEAAEAQDALEDAPEIEAPSVPRRRAKRIPRGLSVVSVTPNGSRVLSDGSYLTKNGRLLAAEQIERLRETARKARAGKAASNHQGFNEPPVDTEVSQREAVEPMVSMEIPEFEREAMDVDPRAVEYMSTPREEFPTEQAQPEAPPPVRAPRDQEPRPWGEVPRRGGGVIRRVLGWHSDAPPRITDLPEQTTEEWWDNIVQAYLLPDTDPVALCRNNHITREALDTELGRRGIRAYSRTPDQAGVVVPPPRMH